MKKLKVITIRLDEKEYNELCKIQMEIANKYKVNFPLGTIGRIAIDFLIEKQKKTQFLTK